MVTGFLLNGSMPVYHAHVAMSNGSLLCRKSY